MENPYPWPEEIKAAWLQGMAAIEINRYPDAGGERLKQRLAETFSIAPGQAILLGNGSDEIIQVITLALAREDAVLLAPEPGFVMYRVIAEMAKMRFVGVPLVEDDFSLNVDAWLAAIDHHQPALIFLAWPNNPTGNLFDKEAIEQILLQAPGLVVIDEAYHAFCGQSFVSSLGQYDNLLVMRTLSKLGLAGLRLGFLAGPRPWLAQLEKIRLPYNINSLTQFSASFILEHMDILNDQAGQICRDREQMYQALTAMPGIRPWPSEANFILFKTVSKPAGPLYKALKNAGILIKNLHNSHPFLENCLRVTIGTPAENRAFIEGLRRILS